ncbi:uncharacterized protein B0I36DRAFT_381830 [Microdochium trichocladiopsis]|uniref:Uncharacterized protein n=1 Tax=Microdochium trichocladiopsis TaxID=1682393 RepID=A0A9P9BSP1_9PEZI|nr:uncharacterized protein B0I36DRAFT_381830 [Microdochium trichocladiopsis]KAH7035025.1 hypothetical protein B0I36DRAFT_381830 [Microdochium trichocladiopsis]
MNSASNPSRSPDANGVISLHSMDAQHGHDAQAQLQIASSRDSLPSQVSTSQLSMAFIYYSVQLQKAALSRLEAKLTGLAAQTPASNEHFAALKNEISALRTSKQECDKLMAEHKESLQQYSGAKIDDLRAELEQVTTSVAAQIASNKADVEAMALVQKSLDEKFQAQQQAIQELSRSDESAKRQEELIQGIQKLLSKCNTILETRVAARIDNTPRRHCQKLQHEVARLHQQLADTIEKLDCSIKYPESVISPKRRGRGEQNDRVPRIVPEVDEATRRRRAVSSSSTASYPSEVDESDDLHMRRGNSYLRLYDKYRRAYRIQKPQSEKRFIRRFLSKLDRGQAHHTQHKILQAYPSLVVRRERPQDITSSGAKEFIRLDNLSWPLVADAIASMTEDDFKLMTGDMVTV